MRPSLENERLIRLVMDLDSDLEARDPKGRTALHVAVEKGRVSMIEMLLEEGADVNAADDAGDTPLLVAANNYRYKYKLLPLLVKHGADVAARDRRGRNVLHFVAGSSWTCASKCIDSARVLIENGASLDDREYSTQYQPIHEAASFGNYELVRLFLDHGANVNARAQDDCFPLYLASDFRNTHAALTLLELGANVHLRTTEGRTALHKACNVSNIPTSLGTKQYRIMHIMPIRLLLMAGADVLAKDRDGKTPFALMNRSCFIEYNYGIRLMIKALALKKVCQPSIELKDESIIEEHEELLDYYRDCIAHLSRMKFTRFIKSCTFLELLTKSHYQIAELMRNPNFEANFFLYDLSGFSMYADDIRRAFMCARNQYPIILKQEEMMNEAVGHILPYTVVRKLVHYVKCDERSHLAYCAPLYF